MQNSYSYAHYFKDDKWKYSAYHPVIFPKKLISKRKGARKKELKKWLMDLEIRDWDI